VVRSLRLNRIIRGRSRTVRNSKSFNSSTSTYSLGFKGIFKMPILKNLRFSSTCFGLCPRNGRPPIHLGKSDSVSAGFSCTFCKCCSYVQYILISSEVRTRPFSSLESDKHCTVPYCTGTGFSELSQDYSKNCAQTADPEMNAVLMAEKNGRPTTLPCGNGPSQGSPAGPALGDQVRYI
jgi:hypothetical protein